MLKADILWGLKILICRAVDRKGCHGPERQDREFIAEHNRCHHHCDHTIPPPRITSSQLQSDEISCIPARVTSVCYLIGFSLNRLTLSAMLVV